MEDLGVLIVDDDESTLRLISAYVKAHGFRVYTDKSAEDAITRLKRDSGKIDIMVTDIMMARMSGWDLLNFLRKELKVSELEMPVIVMSAVDGIDLRMEHMRHGANDWIDKPIKPLDRLVHKIQALLGLEARKL
jgi:CheY-like chemotaxis protein